MIGEVTDAVTNVWRAGTVVESFWGLVKTIVRRVTSRRRKLLVMPCLARVEDVAAAEPSERWRPSAQDLRALLPRVRGRRRRRLLRQLGDGLSLATIAGRLGVDVAKVNEWFRDLLEHLGIAGDGAPDSADSTRGCMLVARREMGHARIVALRNPRVIQDGVATCTC